MKNNKKQFIAYEYVTLTCNQEMKPVYIDCYQNFGWEVEDSRFSSLPNGTITLKLKRDRRIENRTKLNELQERCESTLDHIHHLEQVKTSKPIIRALLIGVVGTVCMTLAVFSYLAGMILFCVLFAIPGFIGWILPYFIHQRVKRQQELLVNPQIDADYEDVYQVCESANDFLDLETGGIAV